MGREPKCCLGRIFDFKLGYFDVMLALLLGVYSHLHLELKTRPRVCTVSLWLGTAIEINASSFFKNLYFHHKAILNLVCSRERNI
jgi:hypothetical protein